MAEENKLQKGSLGLWYFLWLGQYQFQVLGQNVSLQVT